ncbi:MAG: DUF2490 domain-containing protein [Bacteroidota bacterium]|nr:DUF2490 domain-containing protein [Bacteroidota bacterium]
MHKFILFAKILFVIHFAKVPVQAQGFERENQFHSWFYYIGDHKISDKWGVHPEVQFRRTGFGNKPQGLVLRSAINFYPVDHIIFSAGYVYSRQYPYGAYPVDFQFPEHRIYQQVELTNEYRKFDLSYRMRLEQRWIEEIIGVPDPDSEGGLRPESKGWPFQNRLRLNLALTFPFKGDEIDNGEFYLFASNEIFYSFGKSVSNEFDQNRAQIGIGYQLGSFGRAECGYLYQLILDPGNLQVENNHTLTIAWISRFNFN